MSATLSALAQLLLGTAALGCLCLSMDRHARQTGARITVLKQKSYLRVAGWALLGLATLAAISATGWGLGLVWLLGIITLAALVIISLLTYGPQWVVRTTTCGALGGFLSLGIGLIW